MYDSRKSLAISVLVTILLVLCEGTYRQRVNYHRQSKAKTAEDPLKVETQNGWVRGRKIRHGVYGWNGIPYAKPPVGGLRFEPPQKPDNWTGTWDATYDRNECVQTNPRNRITFLNPTGSEDCLYVNVYSPKQPQKVKKLLPVMVWVHGGGFFWGNSSYATYGPDALVKKDVIVVSFNYRLGIFGFLSTRDKVAPGNNGLRDQLFALQWVQDNVEAFGGDPKAVTVFGESAGGASVSYLVLSQREGLFQRAIMESGTALCLWSVSNTAKIAALEVAKSLQINTNDSQQLVSELKQVDTMELQKSANIIMIRMFFSIGINGGLVFGPVIEAESEDAVITGSNYNKLNTGNFQRVPQIIGHNSAEAVAVQGLVQLFKNYIDISDLSSSRLVPNSMKVPGDQRSQIGDIIQAEYDVLNTVGHVEYLSDDEFVRPIQQTVNFTSKYVTTYFYQFSYTNQPDQLGAAHAEELNFIFNSQFNSPTDNFVRECITSYWSNFAKTGNPTPPGANICGGTKWRPLIPNDRSRLYYLNINRTMSNDENPRKDKMDFWRKLFNQYGNRPYITY